MDKKSFTVIIIVLVLTFASTIILKQYHPESTAVVSFDNFPLELDGWVGSRKTIAPYVIELLKPQDIFSATYVNDKGFKVSLFFDFFSSGKGLGGPHSPRNCLPGSGWTIHENKKHIIKLNQKEISVHRLNLRYEKTRHIMDFWYVTHYGETGNDYLFKIYEILNSLTFQPKDVAFIRFIVEDSPENIEALNEFQQIFTKEIYKFLPFES